MKTKLELALTFMILHSFFCLSARAQTTYTPYTFTTMAGSAGVLGSADGTNGAAQFNDPEGVAVDNAGNVYVADTFNETIRKITPAGVVTTLAGSPGQIGSADGTNSTARFYLPDGVAVDSAGNVYVADAYNHTIRKITPAGAVTTLAGSVGASGTNDGTGNAAQFNFPIGVVVDSAGNVFVADTYNHTIRKITPAGAVTTLAGSAGQTGNADGTNGTAQFNFPIGVAVDSAGNVYVADTYNQTIRKITPAGTNWVVTTLAGSAGQIGSADGTGSAARFYYPAGVAVDSAGNIFVADTENFTIRKITPAGVVTTLAGVAGQYGNADGTGSAARFHTHLGNLAVDSSGNVYVVDTINSTIRKGTLSIIYDPGLGMLPENQGFTRVDNGMAPNPSVSGGVLNQNTTGNNGAWQWWNAISSDAFNFSTGFTLEARLYVVSSGYNPDIGGGSRRAGYELWALDDTGRYLGINITSSGLWLDTSGTNSAPPVGGTFFTPFDATSGFNNYRLVAKGDTATLFINGTAFLSTSLGPVVDSVDTNTVAFGDNTTFVGSQTELAWFRVKPAVPLAISVHLQSQTVVTGTNVSFNVVAAGTEPLTYQWTFYGTNLIGQTNASLLLTNVPLTKAGPYCVVVVDAWNITNTDCTTLTVLNPPGIATQPVNQTVPIGSNVTFTVVATGSAPLLYQWRYNGANILGATNSTYTITNAQPQDGGNYSVLVANPVGVAVSLDVTLKVISPALPFADNFLNRGGTNGFSGVGSGSNTNATREAGETNHIGKFGSHSVWLQWTAPANGVATFSTRGSSFDTLLAIYTGTGLTNLSAKAGDDDSGGFFTSETRVNVTAETNYIIAIDGLASASGDIVLSWNLANIPRIPIITQQPTNVTASPGGDAIFCVTADSTNVTYQWYFNNSLVITGATVATLTVSNIDRLNVGFYSVDVTSTNGQTVRSLAGSLEIGSEVGTHSFDKLEDLFQAIQSGGGNFMQSLKLSNAGGITVQSLGFPSVSVGTLGSQIINNFNSTTEQGEPTHSDVIGGSSRWYLLTPATNGTLIIDTIGSDIDTVLAIYTGSGVFSLQLVASDDNGAPDGMRSLVRFPAAAGTDYLIGVDSKNGTNGIININWRLGTPPSAGGPIGSQALNQGSTLVLQAGNTNAIPDPSYQWRQDDVNLLGATNATYTLANIQYHQGGVYSVVVSNYVGVVTNVIATVSVQGLLLVLDQSLGVPNFRVMGRATQAGVLGLSTNLTLWAPLYTNFDPSVPVAYLDTNSHSRTKGYYRYTRWP